MSYNIIKKDGEYIIYKETHVLGIKTDTHIVEVFPEEQKEEAINRFNDLANGGK